MKRIFFVIAIIAASCNAHEQHTQTTDTSSVKSRVDTTLVDIKMEEIKAEEPPPPPPPIKTYANARFKDVSVKKTGDHQFLIKGKAQVFEANISWVVEDGHDELKKGFQMTDAGAPAWGNFTFSIDVQKKRQNSTLTLILFESSAKDGSRQYELPVRLY
ncbi:MAG: Gmad2 immunoglobulin-like domain-containing protein [Ferruginibacter sp.]